MSSLVFATPRGRIVLVAVQQAHDGIALETGSLCATASLLLSVTGSTFVEGVLERAMLLAWAEQSLLEQTQTGLRQ
ncbi:MAG: hypothetical protein JWN04_5086 [Myxococcaceae bacterium]|nr:hypothetical protein [Myxococcaceae bacterium]